MCHFVIDNVTPWSNTFRMCHFVIDSVTPWSNTFTKNWTAVMLRKLHSPCVKVNARHYCDVAMMLQIDPELISQ